MALASCGTAPTSSSITIASAPGVTSTSILLGTVANLSGPNAAVNRQIIAGERAVFRAVNAEGGVNGRRITLEVANDHGTQAGQVAALKSLAVEAGVFAFVGNGALSSSVEVTGTLKYVGVPSLLPIDSYPPNTIEAKAESTVVLEPPPTTQVNLALTALGPLARPTVVGLLIPPGMGLSHVSSALTKLVPQATLVTLEETGTKQSESTVVDEMIGDRITDLVSFVGSQQTVSTLASLPATDVPSRLVFSTQVPSTSDVVAALGAAHVNTAGLAVMRVSAFPSLNSLTGLWQRDIALSRAALGARAPFTGATYEGMQVGWGSVGLIADAGLNPTRLVLLTRAGRSTFVPPFAVTGSYVMAEGPSSGYVLQSVSHQVVGGKIIGTPPRLSSSGAKA